MIYQSPAMSPILIASWIFIEGFVIVCLSISQWVNDEAEWLMASGCLMDIDGGSLLIEPVETLKIAKMVDMPGSHCALW